MNKVSSDPTVAVKVDKVEIKGLSSAQESLVREYVKNKKIVGSKIKQ